MVAPFSGLMLAIVARSGSESSATPGPKYSTNLSTTLCRRSVCVTVSTMSVEVTPGRGLPASRQPITSGTSIATDSPSAPAPPSRPPTPQPRMPRLLIIAVWLSMPSTESG